MSEEIVLLHRRELRERDPLSGDRLELHRSDEHRYTLSINGYDGLLIGLTEADLLDIVHGLQKVLS